MIKIFLPLILTIFINIHALAIDIYVSDKKKLPIELDLILTFYQTQTLSSEDKIFLDSSILEIDSLAQNLTEEEILFVTKTEIYKTLLLPKDSTPLPKNQYDQNIIKLLQKASQTNKHDPFISWFLNGIILDLEKIFSSSAFKDLMLLKGTRTELPIEVIKIERRLDLLLKAVQSLKSSDQNVFRNELKEKVTDCLKNITTAFKLLISKSKIEVKTIESTLKNLKYFKIVKLEEQKTPSANVKIPAKSVDQILAPALGPIPNSPPKPDQNADWENESQKTPNIDPKTLPKPVEESDWLPDF